MMTRLTVVLSEFKLLKIEKNSPYKTEANLGHHDMAPSKGS